MQDIATLVLKFKGHWRNLRHSSLRNLPRICRIGIRRLFLFFLHFFLHLLHLLHHLLGLTFGFLHFSDFLSHFSPCRFKRFRPSPFWPTTLGSWVPKAWVQSSRGSLCRFLRFCRRCRWLF